MFDVKKLSPITTAFRQRSSSPNLEFLPFLGTYTMGNAYSLSAGVAMTNVITFSIFSHQSFL